MRKWRAEIEVGGVRLEITLEVDGKVGKSEFRALDPGNSVKVFQADMLNVVVCPVCFSTGHASRVTEFGTIVECPVVPEGSVFLRDWRSPRRPVEDTGKA